MNKCMTEYGQKFRFDSIISTERKEIIQKHPQCEKFFRFHKYKDNWKYYIKSGNVQHSRDDLGDLEL